jgi:tetratricopeptide (TPR) repeat protein
LHVAEDPVEAYNRGLEYLDYNEPDMAILAFTEAVQLKPSAAAWFARGFAHAVRGDLEQAIADYNEAIRLDPAHAAAYHNRAAAFRELGRLDQADQDETKYRELKSRERPQRQVG